MVRVEIPKYLESKMAFLAKHYGIEKSRFHQAIVILAVSELYQKVQLDQALEDQKAEGKE